MNSSSVTFSFFSNTSVITARKRSLGQGNIFTPVCHSVHGGGHVWLLWGGMHGCSGGMHGFIWGACVDLFRGHAWFYLGACVVALGGHAWFYSGGHAWLLGGHAWFYSGGMHGFIGGHAWFFQFFRIQWDMVNERAVRILLECILVPFVFGTTTF